MNQPDFRLGKISTVMLGVREIAGAVSFYRDQLGLTIQFEIPGFTFLNAGGVTLCLSEPLARALGGATRQLAGAVELVFSVDEVQSAYEALAARGVRFTLEPHNVTGTQWAANFEDPDGHKLSIFGPRTSPQ
ncbi:MAG TPA: VOC family protein [Terriglobia bacterium]|nr:VOC family protein [Terriglobia bacterium]